MCVYKYFVIWYDGCVCFNCFVFYVLFNGKVFLLKFTRMLVYLLQVCIGLFLLRLLLQLLGFSFDWGIF